MKEKGERKDTVEKEQEEDKMKALKQRANPLP